MPWLVVSLSSPRYERKSWLLTMTPEEQFPIVIEEVDSIKVIVIAKGISS